MMSYGLELPPFKVSSETPPLYFLPMSFIRYRPVWKPSHWHPTLILLPSLVRSHEVRFPFCTQRRVKSLRLRGYGCLLFSFTPRWDLNHYSFIQSQGHFTLSRAKGESHEHCPHTSLTVQWQDDEEFGERPFPRASSRLRLDPARETRGRGTIPELHPRTLGSRCYDRIGTTGVYRNSQLVEIPGRRKNVPVSRSHFRKT